MSRIKLVLLISILCLSIIVVGQEPSNTSLTPFNYSASYTGDAVRNFHGGISQNNGYLGLANMMVNFSTDRANWWGGGELMINGACTHGATPSESFIGDFQGAVNIEAGNLTYMHELWYKQTFGKLTTVIGLQDVNAEFITSDNSSLYINSSFGTPSTISENIHAPIFPLTAFGLQLHYNFSERNALKIAVFDGFPDGADVNPYNLKWRLGNKGGYLTFTEFSTKLNLLKDKEGSFRFGAYTHNHLTDTTKFIRKYGFYLVADQYLYTSQSGQKYAMFIQASYGPAKENLNNYYLGLGLNISNIKIKNINSTLGIAMAHAGLKTPEYIHETSFELTYKMELTENISIQPDVQYIINPMGTGVALNNATVGILRFGLNF